MKEKLDKSNYYVTETWPLICPSKEALIWSYIKKVLVYDNILHFYIWMDP